MFSIIIPSLNNLNYLRLCIESIKKNSSYEHEIIVHANIAEDGTLEFLKENKIKHTHTKYNSGIPEGVNKAAKLATTNYIVYAHDDFYFLPGWDKAYMNEIKSMSNKLYYLSGTMVQNGQVTLDCGSNLENFDENKLLKEYKNIKFYDFQGSTWAPHLIHKETWNKVGGFSEEYFPGTGSDPDLNMKLWKIGVRTFKGLKNCMVYHFGSIVTRKYKDKNIKTESGSRGDKIFLKKWGFKIKFFNKYYLKGCISKNGKIYCNRYDGPLSEPKKDISFLIDLFINKLAFYYYKMQKN